MSRSASFSFTNTTASTHDVTPVELGLVTNYAIERDTARQAVLNNKTAPIDAQEIISFRSNDLAVVNNDLNIQNPAKVAKGIRYGVEVQETLVITDTADPSYRVDEPIVATLTIRHGKSGDITNALIAQVVTRLISSCRRADGTWRFDDMMRSAERPVVD